MLRFFVDHLPKLIQEVNPTFQKFREIHRAYGKGEITYPEWMNKLRASGKGWTKAVREEARAEAKKRKRNYNNKGPKKRKA